MSSLGFMTSLSDPESWDACGRSEKERRLCPWWAQRPYSLSEGLGTWPPDLEVPPPFIHFPCLFPSHTFLSLSTVLHIVPITKCSCDATDHYYVFFSPSTFMFYTFLPIKKKEKKIWNRPGCSSPLPALHPEDRADRDLPHLDGVPSAS